MRTPEQNLWHGVLARATHDLKTKPKLKEEVLKWFNEKNNEEIGSFIWICDTLQLDPDKIIRGINKLI